MPRLVSDVQTLGQSLSVSQQLQNLTPPPPNFPYGVTLQGTTYYWSGAAWVAIAHDSNINQVTHLLHELPINYGSAGGVVTLNNPGFTSTTTPGYYTTAQQRFTAWSFLVQNGAVQFYNTSQLSLGTNDFTIEGWFYPTANPAASINLIDWRDGAATGPVIDVTSTGALFYQLSGVTQIAAGGTMTLNAWNHVALSRNNGTTRLFLNGSTMIGSFSDSTNYSSSHGLAWGNSNGLALIGSAGLTGYVGELRITSGSVGSGAGRYTATFTPPSTRFSDT
jgi:hypothetical protein